MRLLFLDSSTLLAWTIQALAGPLKRTIDEESEPSVQHVVSVVEACKQKGVKLGSTVSASCEVITQLYKKTVSPFRGGTEGFPERKRIAAVAAAVLREDVEMLSPDTTHFTEAERLWFAWCSGDGRGSYAQFSDYLDAALILRPPQTVEISHALLGHHHVDYVLRKQQSSVMVNIVEVKLRR